MMRRDEGGEVEGGPQTLVNCRSGQGRLEEELCIWQVAQTCQTGVVRIVWLRAEKHRCECWWVSSRGHSQLAHCNGNEPKLHSARPIAQ